MGSGVGAGSADGYAVVSDRITRVLFASARFPGTTSGVVVSAINAPRPTKPRAETNEVIVMSESVPNRRQAEPRSDRRARAGMGYYRSEESGRWIEICLNPRCPCYGVTTHWESGRPSEHRPFTGKELIDNARWGLDG